TGGDAFSERNLASAYIAAGEFSKAREHLEKSLAKEPMHPHSNHYMGTLLYNEKRYAEAIAYNLKALEVSPDLLDAHYNIALCAVEFGNKAFALEHLGQAVKKDPAFWESLLFYGQILREEGRYGEAKEALEKAARVAPWSVQVAAELKMAEDGLAWEGAR
ncbi:tetratricopeptide repeat protein, partial [bacterium]